MDELNFSAFPENDRLKRVAAESAAGTLVNCGWVRPEKRTDAETKAHAAAEAEMPRFGIRGAYRLESRRYPLWKAVRGLLGKDPAWVWQQTGSCFPAGALVRMADGSERSIETVRVGESVISHTGRPRTVTRVFSREYTGHLTTLRLAGHPFPLTATADHRVFTPAALFPWTAAGVLYVGDRLAVQHTRPESDPTAAIDLLLLLGDRAVDMGELAGGGGEAFGPYSRSRAVRQAGSPGASENRVRLWGTKYGNGLFRRIAVTESFARLVGLYLAEGGVNAGRVTFTFSAAERDTLAAEVLTLVRGVFGVEGELTHTPDRGRTTVRFNNANLAAVLKALIPGGLYEKRVPGLFFDRLAAVKAALVGGWFAGDGYYKRRKRGVVIVGVTASEGLARDMAILAAGASYRVTTRERPARGHSRRAWEVNLSGPAARVQIAAAKGMEPATLRYRDRPPEPASEFGTLRTVRAVDSVYIERVPVYCLEVEEDHSFLVNDVAVHNCVGASTGSATMVAQGVEIHVNGDREEYRHPWWLFAYGRSRFHGGIKGRGEGSFGSAMAKALVTDGIFELDPEGQPDLPDPTIRNGWSVHSSSVEMDWSDGGKIAANWLTVGKTRLFKTAARIRSADEMIAALANGYVCITAGMFGFSPMVPPVEGKSPNQVRLVRRWNASWAHQMFDVEFWDHPDLGPIFGKGNQWGGTAHGTPPSDYPNCMYYVTHDLQDRILRDSDTECYVLSGYDGYPARESELNFSAF